MTKLKTFKEEILQDGKNRELGKPTPILDRLQIHLNTLSNPLKVNDIISEKNLENEVLLSLLHQVVYPAKKKNILRIVLDGKEIEGKKSREKIQNLIKNIGVKKISTLPKFGKFLFKTNDKKDMHNAYKIIDKDHSFDTHFGDIRIGSIAPSFEEELKKHLKLNIKFQYKEIYNY
jgi:hypothetical protein